MVKTMLEKFKYLIFLSMIICSLFLLSCSNMKTVIAFQEGDNLIVEKSEFIDKQTMSEYESIIVTSNYIRTPIVLLNLGGNKYEAYSLECTHDGERLEIIGDKLVCNTGGSEYDKKGKVIKNPASKDLRQYSIDKTATTIEIRIN